MKSIDLFIFDLDGTLAATGNDLVQCVNHTLRTVGLQVLDPSLIISFVGDGIRELMLRALGPGNQACADQAIDIFNAYYTDHALDETVLYPGVVECLVYFRQKKKVVISNKRQIFVEHLLAALGIRDHFDQVIGGDRHAYMKPDARLVPPLLEAFQTVPGRTAIVGDGKNDILLAKNAGIVSCAFLGGLTKPELLLALRPDYNCKDLTELSAFFV
jgi:phosphoglycolate phosphatase